MIHDPARRPGDFLRSDRGLMLILYLLCLLARLLFTAWDRCGASLVNIDAYNYLLGGMEFAKTGRITHDGFPTAQIMPGMPVLIGLIAMVFSDQQSLLWACRFVWIFLGSFTSVFYYRSIRLFTSKAAAFLGACVCLLPLLVQIDCYLLTEPPYYLFFSMALFYTLKMGQDRSFRYLWCYAFSVLAALLFRANILTFLPFTLLYLLSCRYSWKELLRRSLAVALVLLLFIVPWSIRNYRLFHSFIPISYGSGSPLLEGTYQGGDYYLTDEELLDVYGPYDPGDEVREKYPEIFDADGRLLSHDLDQYYRLLKDRVQALYRIRVWLKLHPGDFFKANFLVKPRASLNWVWYYYELFGITWNIAHRARQLNFLFCLLSLLPAFLLKKDRKVIGFLLAAYLVNLLLVTSVYAGDRYAQQLMAYRYVAAGIGLDLWAELLRRWRTRSGPSDP